MGRCREKNDETLMSATISTVFTCQAIWKYQIDADAVSSLPEVDWDIVSRMAGCGYLQALQQLLLSFSFRHGSMNWMSVEQKVSTFEIHRVVSMLWRKIVDAGVFFEKVASMLQRLSMWRWNGR
jgi:hypothetical protein